MKIGMDADTYVVNVDGAVERDGGYLFIERAAGEEHAAGSLAFPGGKLEAPPGTDDALAATARRELAEEVGVEVGDVEVVTSRTFEANDGALCLNVVARCEFLGGEAHVREPEEVAAVHWLAPEELRGHPDAPPYLVEYLELVEEARLG